MPYALPKRITRGTKGVAQNAATIMVIPKGQKNASKKVLNLLGSIPSKSPITCHKHAKTNYFALVSNSYSVLSGIYLDLLGGKDKIGIFS